MKTTTLLLLLLSLQINIFAQQKTTNTVESVEIINIENPDISKLNNYILKYLNKARKATNTIEFIYSLQLEKAAQYHTKQMSEIKFFGHYNSYDKGLETPLKRILKFEGNYPFIAENIANIPVLNSFKGTKIEIKIDDNNIKYYNDKGIEITNHSYESLAKRVVNDWMNSEKHRKNILNPNLIETGIGVIFHSKGKGYYKQYYALITQNLGGF